MLGGKEDFLVSRQGFFQGEYAGFASHHKRSHHVGKNDYVPDWHHGQLAGLEFIFIFFFGRRQNYKTWEPEFEEQLRLHTGSKNWLI